MLPHSCAVWLKSVVHTMANDDGSDNASEAPERPTVLIIEDEVLNAWHLSSVFRSKGFDVLGPAASLVAAEALIETRLPDVAILDVNIRGKLVFPVARRLAEQGVPLVFATAHAREDGIWPEDLAGYPRLQKPFLEDRLVGIVRALLAEPS